MYAVYTKSVESTKVSYNWSYNKNDVLQYLQDK